MNGFTKWKNRKNKSAPSPTPKFPLLLFITSCLTLQFSPYFCSSSLSLQLNANPNPIQFQPHSLSSSKIGPSTALQFYALKTISCFFFSGYLLIWWFFFTGKVTETLWHCSNCFHVLLGNLRKLHHLPPPLPLLITMCSLVLVVRTPARI